MAQFQPDRALEIVAPKYGTAYRIGGRLLLTCRHLFDNGNDCKVRFRSASNYSDKQDIDAKVIWKAPDNIDIALVELPETIETCNPVGFGLLPYASSTQKVKFDFLGFPLFLRYSEDGIKYATGLHIEGTIDVANRAPHNRLLLNIKDSPDIQPTDKQLERLAENQSPWEGTSGSAIVCYGLVIGVQSKQPIRDRLASLEAESLARVYDNPEWCEILEKRDIDPNPTTTGLGHEDETRLSSKDPLSQVRDYVPTEFELLDHDFYKKRKGENIPILRLPSAAKNWSLITQGSYIEREQQGEALNLVKSLKDYQGISFFLIRGNPGEGKTALMKWLAYQLTEQNEIVLQKQEDNFAWLDLLYEFSQQVQQKPIYLIADDLFREDEYFLEALEENELQFPLIIIGTTRWNENQQERLEYQGYRIEGLDLELSSIEERERILRQIRQADQGVNERLNRLSINELAQLMNAPTMLTLMLQLSEGKPFDQIIADVIKKLPNEPNYPVYQAFGVVCAFYQYGIAVYPNILALCLPNYSQDAIDNVVNLAPDTDLKGLIQIGSYAGYEGLTAIHQEIAKYAITVTYKRRNNQENLPYLFNLLEKYLRVIIPNLESEVETHQRWFCHQLRDLTSNNQQDLVKKILRDFSEKVAILQQKCRVSNLIRWKDIYRNIDMKEKSEHVFDLLLSLKPEDGYEFQYKFNWIKKRGKAEQIREIIVEFQMWLESHPDDFHVRPGYLVLIGSHGTSDQKQKAIIQTNTWLESHPDDVNVRQGYLVLIGSHGTSDQKQKAIIQTNTWLESHPDDVNVRQGYLALVGSHGTSDQKQKAIIQTNTWLESHPDDVNVRQGYLALVGSHGTSDQKQKAIIQTNTWLESHPDDFNVRQGYLAVVGRNGTSDQKQQAIVQTSNWLEFNPNNRLIMSLFFGYYRDYLDYETCYQLAESLEFIQLPINQWQIKIYIANFFRDYGELERAKNLYLPIIKGATYQIKNKNNKSLEKTLDFASLNHAYLLLLLTPPQWNEAIRKLHWLLSKKPEHCLINLYLAKAYQAKAKSYLQFSSKQIHQQAIDYYKKAIQYDQQKNGYFWYEFGCFYRESMNNIPQAITCFKNSLEQNINLPAALELAEIELRRGNKQKAQTILQPALELPLTTRLEREQREHLTPRINAIFA
jgi:hypothetical protein